MKSEFWYWLQACTNVLAEDMDRSNLKQTTLDITMMDLKYGPVYEDGVLDSPKLEWLAEMYAWHKMKDRLRRSNQRP